jgi:hypothetical protein
VNNLKPKRYNSQNNLKSLISKENSKHNKHP